MRIGTWRRAASGLLALWLIGGPLAHTARAATLESVPAGAPAAVAGCPSSVSCGSGCTASLATGFCSVVVKWSGAVEVGGIQIGPSIKFTCDVCECWYTYTSSTGNSTFKRTTKLGCSAGSPDIHVV